MVRNNFRMNAALVGLLALAAVGRARAQDTLAVQGPAMQQGRVHIVQLGETLWELARLYLGDPLLWPEIYRINTLVVEDPHWIFPGEELRLVPPDTTQVFVEPPANEVPEDPQNVARPADEPPPEPEVEVPETPPPPPVNENAPTIFAERQATPVRRRTGDAPPPTYRPVYAGRFYAAGFLTEGDQLPWAQVRGNVEPGSAGGPFGTSTAMVFGRIGIQAPSGATYHVGDTLLTARLARPVSGWGRVVLPTGLARVQHVSGRDVIAEVITQFARVTSGQVAMPIEPFRDPGAVRPQPVADGMTGRIVTVRDLHPLPNQQDIVFIDRGRQDGIVPGDVFEVLRIPGADEAAPDRPPDQVALMQVVHVRERSSSAVLLQIVRTGVRSDAPVRLVGKMPS